MSKDLQFSLDCVDEQIEPKIKNKPQHNNLYKLCERFGGQLNQKL